MPSTRSRALAAWISLALRFCVAFSSPSLLIVKAQVATGTILGTVSDPSGAAIGAANVTAINEATGRIHSATTDAEGLYLFPLLPIGGSYSVAAEAPGFQKFLQRGIVLQVNDNVRVDAALAVGAVSDTVEVAGAPPQIDTRNSTLGTVIESRTIAEIPLNGRNPIQLASLSSVVCQKFLNMT